MLLAADAAHHRPGHRRVDGRFWTLTDDDKADDDEVNQPAVTSPTPLDLSCESIQVGYSEEHVANCIDEVVPPTDSAWDGLGEDGDRVEVLRRIVRRRMSASAVQPWKGPLPKGSGKEPTAASKAKPPSAVTQGAGRDANPPVAQHTGDGGRGAAAAGSREGQGAATLTLGEAQQVRLMVVLHIKEVEESQPQTHDGDVHMADGDDRDGDRGDVDQYEYSEKGNDDRNPSSSSASDKQMRRFMWTSSGGQEDSRLGLQGIPASREDLVKPLGSSQAPVHQLDRQEVRQPGIMATPTSNGSRGRQEMLRFDGVESPSIGQEARVSSPCITTDFYRSTEKQPLQTQDPVQVHSPGQANVTLGTEAVGHNPTVISTDEVISFGGIPDPTSTD
ncbi:hypothetical protein ZWY2020_032933 [Hordeum vulgare]|nr:hypothetical protein ZWY2020_032933 [Hordeum vulgare]